MTAHFAWTPANRAAVNTMLAEGKTYGQIAKVIGATRNAVAGRVRRDGEGAQTRQERMTWTDERIQTLRDMAAQGNTAPEIAEALGMKPGPIYDKASRLQVKLPRGKRSPPAPSRLARAFQHGTGSVDSSKVKAPYDLKTAGPTPQSRSLRMWDTAFGPGCCKWAVGEDDLGFIFCAAPSLLGLPYCSSHAQVGYSATSSKPPSAVKDSARRAENADDGEPKPLDFGQAA